MNEIKYNINQIKELNKTKTWRSSLDTTYVENNRQNDEDKKQSSYVLHATGEFDMMNGRKYIALPSELNVKNKYVKTKYNLL